MSPRSRVVVPRLTNRSALIWVGGTFLAVLAACCFVWVTQPENRWTAGLAGPLLVLLAVWMFGSRTWIDLTSRTLARRAFFLPRRPLAMSEVVSVDLVSNGGGGVLLGLGAGRARRLVPLLLLSPYVRQSQSSVVLAALADLVDETAAPARASVSRELHRQAAFVDSGRPVEDSPLAGRAKGGFARVAGGGGAVGGGASLLP